MQWTTAGLAVAATLCAILQPEWTGAATRWYDLPLHYAIIAIPIVTSVLFAWLSHFRPGSRWLLLRGGAESIKREIFRYRTQTGTYSDSRPGPYRATRLAAEVDRVLKALAQSDANRAGEPRLPPRPAAAGDNLSFLTGDEYVEVRLKDQIGYYESKTRRLDRASKWFHGLIYVGGGAGTFLAAVGVNKWVAVSTAIVAVLTARMEAEQQENSLIQYNQALASLKTILNWWTSLSGPEQKEQRNLDRLVDDTEATLAGELAGWVQQMQAAIEKAQKPPEGTAAPAEPTEQPAPTPPSRAVLAAAAPAGAEAAAPAEEEPPAEIAEPEPEPEPEPGQPAATTAAAATAPGTGSAPETPRSTL
jgi:hypothetical protein